MDDLLVNKYKPKTINEFTYPNATKSMINNLMRIDEISFILFGNKGCGKSTILNCIVKEYYGNKDYLGNTLILNSASDQGINYYRNDVKLFCQTNCTVPKKKKIIIFDDFDQINDQCQHVFRNYIDKYQHKIGFILSTSNLHKIINSIQSRFLVINLPSPNNIQVKSLAQTIIDKEGIVISETSLDYIMVIAENSLFRTLHYLEKLKLISNISDYNIEDVFGNVNHTHFDKYFTLLKNKEFNKAFNILSNIYEDGYSVIDILDALFQYIKITDILSEDKKYKIIPIICKYITIFYDIHEHEIELIFLTNNIIKIF
jgi:DNA polymerase III delta prime subunit